MLDKFTSLFAPLACVRCGKEGAATCASCLKDIVITKNPSCYMCNRLTDSWKVCPSCRYRTKLRGAIIASHYEGHIKELILMLKYQRTYSVAGLLAKIINNQIDTAASFNLITSVPAASKHARSRGYNQAELIAKALAKYTGINYRETLARLGQSRQVGTERNKRIKQMRGSMYAGRQKHINGARILLVDDVITTGATVTEAARVLKQAGAKYIWAAAAAKH